MSDASITALVLRPGSVAWTTLHRRKGKLEVAERRAVAFEMPPGGGLDAPEVTARIKPLLSGIKGRVAMALPTDQVLMRVLRLPTQEMSELRSMAELQVDKFSPFPIDQMSVSQEVLEQQEGASRVLVAASQLAAVERLGSVLQAAGVFPREVDVEVLGWWRLLRQQDQLPGAGRQLVLFLAVGHADLVVAQDGVPLLVRSLGGIEGLPPEEAAVELGGDLAYTLTAMEAEWGAQPTGLLTVWSHEELPVAFLVKLREATGLDVATRLYGTLPDLTEGLALRAAERGPHLMDLAPAAWKTSIESRQRLRSVIAGALVFFVVWLLALGGLAGAVQIKLRQIQARKAEVGALQEPAKAVGEMREQVRSLERYSDRTFSALESLREVSASLPAGVELASFTYKKYTQVALRGEADNGDAVYEFIKVMETSGLFPKATLEGLTQKTRAGKARQEFRILLALPGETNAVAEAAP